MTYSFPPDIARLVHEQMSLGQYSSEDAVLLDALRALDDQRKWLVTEEPEAVEGIRRGLEDLQAGRSRSFAEFDTEFRQRQETVITDC